MKLLELDLESLTGHAPIPDLKALHIDMGRLSASAPRDNLLYLIAMRTLGTGSQFLNFHRTRSRGQLLSPLVQRMYYPINPLLLLTALSTSLVRNVDFQSFLQAYCNGLDIAEFESTLFQPGFARDEDGLTAILNSEDSHYRALLDLGASVLTTHGQLIGSDGTPTMLDLYWACWLLANPMYQTTPFAARQHTGDSTSGWDRAVQWGFEKNDDIHNTLRHYEYNLNLCNQELNQSLSAGASSSANDMRMQQLAARQYNATRLLERARRLYFWAPHEISAFSAQTQFAITLMESANETLPLSEAEKEVLRKEHEQFMLPPDILKKIPTTPSPGDNHHD